MPLAQELSVADLLESERTRVAAAAREITRAHGLGEKSVRVLQGSASEVLPRVATEGQVDLVVMGAVSRSRLREVFIGSTAERVLDRLPCDSDDPETALLTRARDIRAPRVYTPPTNPRVSGHLHDCKNLHRRRSRHDRARNP